MMMNIISFDELPEVIKMKLPCSEKYTKFVGYTENPQGRTYFIHESTELNCYLHVKNEFEERALLILKVSFVWLRFAADHIPNIANYLEEIVKYSKMEKEDE